MSAGRRTRPPEPPQPWDWATLRAHSVRVARRYTRSADQAEDIAHEALVRAWRMRSTCRAEDTPSAWLSQITRNEALRVLSRQSPEVLEVEGIPSDSVDDERLGSAPERLDLRASLASLSAIDRVLVALRYEEDLTNAGIAELLGMPEGTVKVRLHRLRRALRGDLDPR